MLSPLGPLVDGTTVLAPLLGLAVPHMVLEAPVVIAGPVAEQAGPGHLQRGQLGRAALLGADEVLSVAGEHLLAPAHPAPGLSAARVVAKVPVKKNLSNIHIFFKL